MQVYPLFQFTQCECAKNAFVCVQRFAEDNAKGKEKRRSTILVAQLYVVHTTDTFVRAHAQRNAKNTSIACKKKNACEVEEKKGR